MTSETTVILNGNRDWVLLAVQLLVSAATIGGGVYAAVRGARKVVEGTAFSEREARREERQEEIFRDVLSLLVRAEQLRRLDQSQSAPNFAPSIEECHRACDLFEENWLSAVADFDAKTVMQQLRRAAEAASDYNAWGVDAPDGTEGEAGRTASECLAAIRGARRFLEGRILSPISWTAVVAHLNDVYKQNERALIFEPTEAPRPPSDG